MQLKMNLTWSEGGEKYLTETMLGNTLTVIPNNV